MNPNPMIGSSLDDLLTEQGLLEEVTAVAVKRILARHLTKTDMAKQMHTSQAALNRLLDDQDTSLTLTTLAKAAKV